MQHGQRPVKIALWQCEQRSADTAANLARLRRTVAEAALEGIDLLVCPEMFLTGYQIDANTVRRLAEPVDGPSARAIARFAHQSGVAVVWGFPERDPNGAIFNAVQAVDADGVRLANYRKTHLFGDHDRACFDAADGAVSIFEIRGWRIGLSICYDIEFPEAARLLALRGADLIVVPTANMVGFDVVPRMLVPARAYENQLVVAYANCCGSEGDPVGGDIFYGGLSTVAGADGSLLAQAGTGPALLRVDLGAPVPGPSRLPYLADRRPDTYGPLTVSPG